MTNDAPKFRRRAGFGAFALVLALAGCSDPPAAPPVAAPPVVPSVVPSVTPSSGLSSSAPPQECAAAAVARLTPEQRAGQLLMIGTQVDSPRGLADEIRERHLGAIFLAGRSKRSAADLRADIEALKSAAGTPLLVALDQEGGSVQTLKGSDFPLIPSAERLGRGPDEALVSSVRDTAKRLTGIGVNVNLAPVADTVPTAIGERNPPIGNFHRQYGSDPAEVAKDIEKAVKASQGDGVLTVLKHFPGLGRTLANTDTSTDAIDRTATKTDPFLEPFAAGIEAGSAAVMMSSASYPKLDDKNIAVFSRTIITDLLREQLKFDGVVMSDDLGAAKAAGAIEPGERAVRFVAAGGDLTLSIRPEDAAPMAAALVKKSQEDQAFAARVTEAAEHVMQAKIRAGVVRC